jgi:hypothetical protein
MTEIEKHTIITTASATAPTVSNVLLTVITERSAGAILTTVCTRSTAQPGVPDTTITLDGESRCQEWQDYTAAREGGAVEAAAAVDVIAHSLSNAQHRPCLNNTAIISPFFHLLAGHSYKSSSASWLTNTQPEKKDEATVWKIRYLPGNSQQCYSTRH